MGVATLLEDVSVYGQLVGAVWQIMTANALLKLFLCGGLLGLGFMFYKKAKNAAKSS